MLLQDLSESGLFGQYMDDLILGSKCQNVLLIIIICKSITKVVTKTTKSLMRPSVKFLMTMK